MRRREELQELPLFAVAIGPGAYLELVVNLSGAVPAPEATAWDRAVLDPGYIPQRVYKKCFMSSFMSSGDTLFCDRLFCPCENCSPWWEHPNWLAAMEEIQGEVDAQFPGRAARRGAMR